MAYYRLMHLHKWGVCDRHNIESAIRAVAAQEAQDVFSAMKQAVSVSTNLILIDAAAYHALAGGEETV